jgi:hypothetical protein
MGTSTLVTVKRVVLKLGVSVLSIGLVQSEMAQATAYQTVTLAVNADYEGADAGQAIGCSFSANASAGTLASTTRSVTLSLTNHCNSGDPVASVPLKGSSRWE